MTDTLKSSGLIRRLRWPLYGLTLCSTLLTGVVLQKYFNVSGYVGEGLRAVGLYQYVYGATEALQSPASTEVIPATAQGQLRLFVLMGQSNMVGLAPLPDSQAPTQAIYTFGNDYRWAAAQEPVDSHQAQVDSVSLDEDAGFGPSVAFAQALQERAALPTDAAIGLIPCAKGGSSMAQWQRSMSDQSLYGSCLKRIQAAAPMGQVAGILFFQGEADAVDPALYPSMEPQPSQWQGQFEQFATDLRQDLGRPDVPLVYAQIGATPRDDMPDNKMFINWAMVRQQQAQVTLPHSARITTDDLETMDGVHFTAESYRTLGQRFADAWVALDR
ncbi:MAG: sialate O-acetylesterase [Cyanobacteria bacterium P01_A01_bin.105]